MVLGGYDHDCGAPRCVDLVDPVDRKMGSSNRDWGHRFCGLLHFAVDSCCYREVRGAPQRLYDHLNRLTGAQETGGGAKLILASHGLLVSHL